MLGLSAHGRPLHCGRFRDIKGLGFAPGAPMSEPNSPSTSPLRSLRTATSSSAAAGAAEEYSRSRLLRMLGVSQRRLRQWERNGLIAAKPSYGFQDLLSLRQLSRISGRVPLRALRDGIAALRRRAPEWSGLAETGLYAAGRRLEVSVGGQRLDPVSGQMRFVFGAATAVAPWRAEKAVPYSGGGEDWFAYAVSLEERPENRDLAAAAYERCLEADPRHASACINLGTLRYHQGDFAAAEACYRRALTIDQTYALAYFDLGNVLDETQRLGEAVAAYARAVALAPGYADAHYNLALAYEKLGQRRKAIPHWRSYLRLDAVSPWANHARAQLKRSLAKETLGVVGKR